MDDRERDTAARLATMAAQPVLFAAAGREALATLSAIPAAAHRLGLRVGGPFGVLVAAEPEKSLRIATCPWLSEMDFSGDGAAAGGALHPGDDEAALLGALTSLVRQLRQDRPSLVPGPSPRLRVSAYAVLDLTEAWAAALVVKLVRLLRAADPLLDLTLLALTGRTAQSREQSVAGWFDVLRYLVSRAGSEAVCHRLYVLDGLDGNGTWLQAAGEMHRLGAEFLLHHGLSPYRVQLRRNEKSCLGAGLDFLGVCGSFSCRIFRGDRTAVARGVAARMAREELADLNRGELAPDAAGRVDQEARETSEALAKLYQARDLDGEPGTVPGQMDLSTNAEREEEALAIIESAVRRVCMEDPVLNLKRFLEGLRPRIAQLFAPSELMARVAERYRAAAVLRRQARETYEPLARWLKESRAIWPKRFLPRVVQPPAVLLSAPASLRCYAIGALLLLFGVLWLGAGASGKSIGFAILGGLLVLASSAVMALPNEWRTARRYVVQEDEDDAATPSPPPVPYRRRAPPWSPPASASLVALGLILLGWSCSLGAWFQTQSFWSILQTLFWLLLALAGCVLAIRAGPQGPRPAAAATDEEAPDLVEPVHWRRHTIGLWCIGIAWVGFCSQMPDAMPRPGAWQWTLLVLGSACILAGVGLARWPWVGHASVHYHAPQLPLPLGAHGGDGATDPSPPREGPPAWVERLLTVPAPAADASLVWPEPRPAGTILDALVEDWDGRLAEVFRRHLAARPGKPLAEMARNPRFWGELVVEELRQPTVGLSEPAHVFALRAVDRWMKGWKWEDLLAQVHPDPQWFDSFVSRSLSPRWPSTRGAPEVDASVIVVGEALWDLVVPLIEASRKHRLVRSPWQDPESIVVVRIVQGLTHGWRGFDAFPYSKPEPAKA